MAGLRPAHWRTEDLSMNESPVTARLRRAVRAVILAEDDRVLLQLHPPASSCTDGRIDRMGGPRRRHRTR